MIIMVTYPECQITQQSCVNNWRPVFSILIHKKKNDDDKNECDKNNKGKIQKNLVALMSEFYDVKLKRSINSRCLWRVSCEIYQ